MKNRWVCGGAALAMTAAFYVWSGSLNLATYCGLLAIGIWIDGACHAIVDALKNA